MLWIFALIVGIALILFLLACLCLHAAFDVRCEGDPALKYLTHEDFPDLKAEPVSFTSDRGQRLRGAVYTCQGVENPAGLVIFAHGMGGGHLSYTTEIHTLARAGFKVLAYDNTGTMASEGKSLRSFYQATKDLRHAIAYVRASESLSGYKIVLAGHSWGAYTVCQTLAFEEAHVAGAVAFSPPDSVSAVICDSIARAIGIPMTWLRPALWIASVIRGGWDSRRRSSSVLLGTNRVPVLLLQGDADRDVLLPNSPLSDPAVMAKDNITGILYEGKAHNVYQTKESERYLGEVFDAIAAAKRQYGKGGLPPEEKARLYNIDYELITREDPEVMETVTEFIKNCFTSRL